jgi:hypothetical protein
MNESAPDQVFFTGPCAKRCIDCPRRPGIHDPVGRQTMLLLELLHGQERRGPENAVLPHCVKPELAQLILQEPDVIASHVRL